MPFNRMIEEVSSILWGLSIAVNIILILVGLPLCLLICCCCRKHHDTFEKDIRMIARNHNILQDQAEIPEDIPQIKQYQQYQQPVIQSSTQQPVNLSNQQQIPRKRVNIQEVNDLQQSFSMDE